MQVPDIALFSRIRSSKATIGEAKEYLEGLKQYLSQARYDDPNYNMILDQSILVEQILEGMGCKVDEFNTLLENSPSPQEQKSKSIFISREPALAPEQLLAEIDRLIAENLPQSQLDLMLLRLAGLAYRPTPDIKALYSSRLEELEQAESFGELKEDLNSLLAIAGESLALNEFLPTPLAEPLTRLAERMAIRPQVFLLALLTGLSSCHKVGTKLVIDPEIKFIVPPNLFAGIVSESGQKKSPVLRLSVQWPLDELEDEANANLQAEYREELEEYLSYSKEERQERFPNGEPTKPDPVDYYFTDSTIEGLNRQFGRQPERGLLYLRDELSGVFSFNKYSGGKGTERQDFLSFYDGSGKKEIRADGFVSRTKKVLVSIFGTIQPEVLRQLMKDAADPDGQWARFLFVVQPLQASKLSAAKNYDINSELINPLYRKVDGLPVTTYQLSPEARNCYELHYNKLEELRVNHPDQGMRAIYSKMQGQIGRLALNLHVIHEVMAYGEAQASSILPKPRIVQAIKLARFFVDQVKLIRASAREAKASDNLAPHLAAIIERSRRVGPVTARDIRQSIWALHVAKADEIRSYFQLLAEGGYGECKGQGVKMIFQVNS